MSQDVNAVKDQSAATGTESSAVSQNNESVGGETDLEIELATTQAALSKALEERENYKQGMLRAKGKTHQDDYAGDNQLTAESVEAIIDRKLKDSQLALLQKKQEALLQQALRERKEALLALKNKSTISNSPSGSGSTGVEKKDVQNSTSNSLPVEQYFTKEQLAHFETISKQIGIKVDLEKVKNNLEKRRAAQSL